MQIAKSQVELAKSIDLLTYLQQYDPRDLVHVSGLEYCTRSHDSLRISNGLWHWCSRGIGGRSALDYLIKVKNMSFVEAVDHLVGGFSVEQTRPYDRAEFSAKEQKKTFCMPPRSVNNDRVIAYLYSRGIDGGLIMQCIRQAKIFESADYHNVVFVGMDEYGVPRYASLRGTGHIPFKGDAVGSDKRFSFAIPSDQKSTDLCVYESAIDLLSHLTIQKRMGEIPDIHRLSLSGVAVQKQDKEPTIPIALGKYLSDHMEIRRIQLCLDHDEPGMVAAKAIEFALRGRYDVTFCLPPKEKDYNDYLCLLYPPQKKNERQGNEVER